VSVTDPDEQRAGSRESWERVAQGWGRRADQVREWGMPVSIAMLEALNLGPGERVLELAAGPGDTGFMAAERISPGGELVCSDSAEAMLEIARRRAAAAGLDNVEFRQLELEWIDLETATVDAVLCRWGIMLIVDPEAAAREIRRVLRPGGRAALAVWDARERNPWATIPNQATIDLGHAAPPDPDAPGMFALDGEGQLAELLEGAGFIEVSVAPVSLERRFESVEQYLEETVDMSASLGTAFAQLDSGQRTELLARIAAAAEPFRAGDGSLVLPGSSLVASAGA
jgi:SAM-dependent methyltransferase